MSRLKDVIKSHILLKRVGDEVIWRFHSEWGWDEDGKLAHIPVEGQPRDPTIIRGNQTHWAVQNLWERFMFLTVDGMLVLFPCAMLGTIVLAIVA